MQRCEPPLLPPSSLPVGSDWFGAGWAVFQNSTTAGPYPPLYDRLAQRAWLGGFGAAWMACATRDSANPERCRQAVRWALVQALRAQPALLGQLLLHGIPDSPNVH